MRTTQEVYDAYRIMPSLQLHQLRVAAVGTFICRNIRKQVQERTVVLACLFHDMGNIIKSDLSLFPQFREPEGKEYWENVKADFISKYGSDAHKANTAIARELELPEAVVALINGIGFSKIAAIVEQPALEIKICEYADTRVGPHGVLTVAKRLGEAKKRYDARVRRKDYYETDENFEKLSNAALELERQIFAYSSIRPEAVNDAAIAPLVDELRQTEIS